MAKLGALAELVGGELIGDPALEIKGVAPIDRAGDGEITFLSNPKYLKKLGDCRAAAIILPTGVEAPVAAGIVCRNPYLAFAKILTLLACRRPEAKGVMAGSYVSPSATLGKGVTVHPGSVVGENVILGDGVILHPNVVLYDGVVVGADSLLHAGVVVRENCRIGRNVIIQPSAVIGGDGFGFAPDGEAYYKIPQVGVVVIEDDVEIGAAACIDRATLGVTRIGKGAKIDNLVQIAHNVVIGENTVIVSQVGISGSTEVGRHCTFGGQAGVAGHLKIGDNVMIGARGGVSGHLAPNQILSGAPVMPHRQFLKAAMTFSKLPEMRKELSQLQSRVQELEQLLSAKESTSQ
ncbi:MAG: UDP-3-O-(3-hydroxymyristoyl)glucosamine N-acyltransferase [Desulfuromonadaceae bacterium]|nr:UDP-3-O-(3-hydroxymyristoyl)glucosamine N-acyltransferase [Desulfuromonadaceae bacterium]